MPTGTVKFFNESKGYGFIAPEGGGNDAFVHITAVERAGMRSLRQDQRVTYDLEEDRRGKMAAVNLKSADEAAPPAGGCAGRIGQSLTDGDAALPTSTSSSPAPNRRGRGGRGNARPCARALPAIRGSVDPARRACRPLRSASHQRRTAQSAAGSGLFSICRS